MTMYLTYFDESGDTGLVNSPTTWFVLNAVLVHETAWIATLEELIKLRRELEERYGVDAQKELKAVNFRDGQGAFAKLHLTREKRLEIYREVMDFQSQLNLKTYSVAVRKEVAAQQGWDLRYLPWVCALSRLQEFCREQGEQAMLYPDIGYGYVVRQCVRQLRRYGKLPRRLGPTPLGLKLDRVLEDPSERRSQDSPFVQLADLNAYATLRSPGIEPKLNIRTDLWDALDGALGDIRLKGQNGGREVPVGVTLCLK